MIHPVTIDAHSREEAQAFVTQGSEWNQQFPDKPLSYVLNAIGVTLNGEDLPEYDEPAPPYRITFLFEDAADAVLFKLRYNNGQGTC